MATCSTDKIRVVFDSRTGMTRRAGVALATMLHADVDDIVEYLAALFGGIAEIGKLQQIEEQRFRA
ncbi:hypothetical protein [Burkholderia ubonensis]|uniref:hypothetical protein n=1 Tax=Burkholderia ubonensis TaxID=101571 RepID=UPI000ADA9209|nr:hypothetical protein [Burkholderia ubonensis]